MGAAAGERFAQAAGMHQREGVEPSQKIFSNSPCTPYTTPVSKNNHPTANVHCKRVRPSLYLTSLGPDYGMVVSPLVQWWHYPSKFQHIGHTVLSTSR